MTYDLLAPAMFASLVVVLLVGFPVAFSLAAVAGAFGVADIATGQFDAVTSIDTAAAPATRAGSYYSIAVLLTHIIHAAETRGM